MYHNKQATLCWDCSKALWGCSWSIFFEPIKGWVVEEFPYKGDHAPDSKTYRVISCPEFDRDAKGGGAEWCGTRHAKVVTDES